MPVDPSISLQAGTGAGAPPNPLQTIGQFAQVQNALNANRLFPGQQQLQQQQIAQGALAQTTNRLNAVNQYMQPILANPNVKIADVMSAVGGLRATGLPVDEWVRDMTETMPTEDGPGLTAWAHARAARALPPAQVPQEIGQNPNMVDNGRTIQPVVIGGRYSATPGAVTTVGAPINRALSPGEAATRVPGPPGEGGAPTSVPLGSVTPKSMGGDMGDGSYRSSVPDALRNPNGPAVPPPAGSSLPGQITTGQSPAQAAARTSTGTTATAGFDNETAAGNRAMTMRAQLDTMLSDANNFTTGTGSQKYLDTKRAIQSWAPGVAHILGIDPSKIASQESFDKVAQQIADAQSAGSDARLASIQGANPSSKLSPEGVNFIIRQLQGNTDYALARQHAAAAWKDQSDYRGFNDWATKNLDPRYFQFNRLTPEQKTTFFNGIPKSDRDAFKRGYATAVQNGWLNAGQ